MIFTKKLISIIAVVPIFAVFFGIIIYEEINSDENRFIITDLGILNQTTLGEPFEYPSTPPSIDVHFVEILPGAESGWHTHDEILIVTVLQGEITVYYEGLTADDKYIIKKYKTGDTFVEAIDTRHNGVNEGAIPTKLHIVTLNPGESWKDIYYSEIEK